MHANKRTAGPSVPGGAAPGGENALYTAQKVHTLAQIVFQQLAGSWTNRAPWTGPAGYAVPQQYVVMPGHGVGPAATPRPDSCGPGIPQGAPPPALFYWYP